MPKSLSLSQSFPSFHTRRLGSGTGALGFRHFVVKLRIIEKRYWHGWRLRRRRTCVDRVNDMRGYQHHQLAVAAVCGLGAKKLPQDGKVAESGKLAHQDCGAVIKKSGDSEGLSIPQFDFGLRFTGR